MTGASTIEVVEAGPLALVQDLGRPGRARDGVGVSGAMDRGALALGNRLVGNPSDAAGIEFLLGGARLRFAVPTWFALTGAWLEARLDGARVDSHTATLAAAGAELVLGTATHGVRGYLALRGGIDAPPALGSRSRDTLAALGPEPLAHGDVLPLRPEPATPVPAIDFVPVDPPTAQARLLALRPGPRQEWFTAEAWRVLLEQAWAVSARADRTGIRLDGPALRRRDDRELPSEGMLPGAIQVSPDGAPTILGPDHPATGGYPVIAVVTDADLDALAQLRPGQSVRFTLATGAA